MYIKIIFFSLFILIAPLSVTGQEVVQTNNGFGAVLSQKYAVSAGGSLYLNDVTGAVVIEGTSGNEIVVQENLSMDVFTQDEAQLILNESKDRYRVQNNRLSISGSGDGDWVKRDWKILVPENISLHISSGTGEINIGNIIATVQVASANGAILVHNVKGNVISTSAGGNLIAENIEGSFKGTTAGGDISVAQISDEVKLVTAGGNIEISGAFKGGSALTNGGDIVLSRAAGLFDLATLGGEINLNNVKGEVKANTLGGAISGSGLNGDFRLETSAGDIKLYQVSAVISAKTNAGSIVLEMTYDNMETSHETLLHTNDGDITVMIPENLPASIIAQIPGANASAGRYNIYSDFTLEKSTSEDGLIIEKNTAINGGGDSISLFTQRGNIYIQQVNK